jgi:hypothetical protein
MADPFDYIESRADADELIEEFGALAYVRRSVATGPAHEPTWTPTDYPTFAVRVAFTQKQIATRNVLETDQRWLVAAGPLVTSSIEPKTPDALIAGGVALPILNCETLNPAGVAVLFDCHIRV